MTDLVDSGVSASLVQKVLDLASPDVLNRLSNAFNESPQTVKDGLRAAAPIVVGSIAKIGSTPKGSSSILELIRRFGFDRGEPDFNTAIAGCDRGEPTTYGSADQSLLATFMGDRADSVFQAISRFSGAKAATISRMVAMLLQIILGIIGRTVRGHDAHWIASYLAKQETSASAAMPAGLRIFLSTAPSVPREPFQTTNRLRTWMPWAAVIVILAGLLLFNSRENPPPLVKSPANALAPTAVSSNDQLRDALANIERVGVPKVITFRELNFDFGTAHLDKASLSIVDDLATSLAKHPNVKLRLEGHTDGVGDPNSDKILSLSRATAVRDRIAFNGVDITGIEVLGKGDEQPIAANTTEEGRALNRRVEVVLLGVRGAEDLAH